VIGEARTLREARTMAPADAYLIAATAATTNVLAGEAENVEPLTPRELEVATLISRGHTNRRIAEVLVIAEKTVANHLQHALDKLEVHSRAQLAARAVELGLAPASSSERSAVAPLAGGGPAGQAGGG
jgi:DNA-binding NarL/FixJ family response regulator